MGDTFSKITPKMKFCPKCEERRDLAEFQRDRSRKDGLKVYCKSCSRKRYRSDKKKLLSVSKKHAAKYKIQKILKSIQGVVLTPGAKRCKACGLLCGFDQFGPKPSTRFNFGLNSKCASCVSVTQKKIHLEERRRYHEKTKKKPKIKVHKKRCSKCQAVRHSSLFNKNSASRDGLGSKCVQCRITKRQSPLVIQGLKNCRKCGSVKSIEQFGFDKTSSDGLRGVCKACVCDKAAVIRIQQSSKVAEWEKKSRIKRVKNGKSRKYQQKRRSDPKQRIQDALRTRLGKFVNGVHKQSRTMELVGCSREEIVKHLESQFKEGMSWENYGIFGWHIDHIIPCSSFDLTDLEQQKKCFHYTNLQPLWARENLKKGSTTLDVI